MKNVNEVLFQGEDPLHFSKALAVREEVFTKEQGYDASIDHDAIDAIAWHGIIYLDNKPVATGRLFIEGNDYQIGRVSVVKSVRGKRLGKRVMQQLIDHAISQQQSSTICLHAQTHAISFYEELGFETKGNEFLEEGEPHILMTMDI